MKMLTTRQIEWDALSFEETKSFAAMAQQYFSATQVLPKIIFGAFDNGTPCGIAVATYTELPRKMEVEHLFVPEAFANHGIAVALLEAMEEKAKTLECAIILFVYPSDIMEREQIEHSLQQNQWLPPALLLHRYFYDSYIFQTSWLEEERILPSEFSLHLWSELTDIERHRMEVQVSQGAYPYSVYPYGKGGDPEPINSVFIRCSGRVVGWLATHREESETITYSGLYVHADHRGRGLSLFLLADSIKRQKASSVRMACFELNESQVGEVWRTFVLKHIAPHAQKQIDILTTWKDLRKRSN